jgi:putative addiction module CopG family antidote
MINVPLNPDVQKYVEEKIKTGQYASPEQAVNAIVRQACQQERLSCEEIEELRAAVDAGIALADRGEFVEFTAEDVIAEGLASRGARKKIS